MQNRLRESNVYYGWVIVAGCFLGGLVVFGISYSFGVFFEQMLADFGRSRGEVSLVFAIQTFVMYLGSAAVGLFINQYGIRRSLLVAMAFLGVGLSGVALSTALWHVILFYSIVASTGLGIVYVIAYATVPKWFERRRGFAGGVASSGLGIGMLVAPAASVLIEHVGWRFTYALVLVAVLVLLPIPVLTMVDHPRKIGVSTAKEFPNGGPPHSKSIPWRTQVSDIFTIACSPSFVLVFLGWICIYATLYVVFAHLVVYTVDIGLQRWVGVWALSVIGGMTSLARIGVGMVSDRLGRTRVFITCSIIMGLSTLMLAGAESATTVFAFAVIYGAAYGGNGALLSPIIADFFNTEHINVMFGLMSISLAISGLFAPPIAGMVYDSLSTYTPAFVTTGLMGVVGAGFVWVADRYVEV